MSRKDYLARKSSYSTSVPFKPPPNLPDKQLPQWKPPPKPGITMKETELNTVLNVMAPVSKALQSRWKNPMLDSTVMPRKHTKLPTPRHDPTTPGAVIMKRPKKPPPGKEIVDVVVDPLLTKHLREHQKEGVKFLYECMMGMRDFDGEGAILADEMGLGKTLQTIALIWTLLKQNPIYGEAPVIKKALIVCPVTLINNWKKEFRKWLGNDRLGVLVAEGTKTRMSDFTKGKNYSVMIIGYERLRTVHEELKKGCGIDIVIADEGHRLKTAQNKSAQAIRSLNTPRRVILSGTPIQNDLSEFFMMVDFVNPGLLGTFKAFTKMYETPILKSRQPTALDQDVEKGEESSRELNELTGSFILRRTAEILCKYLPPKTEYVLLCRPTNTQIAIYGHILASPVFQSALGNPEASLQLITVLKKVCNSPKLLNIDSSRDVEKPLNPTTLALISSIPAGLARHHASSTKIRVLDQLLHTIRTTTAEKVVLVSNFTSTLDLLQTLLTSLAMPFLRLDGSTPSIKRQDLVDKFNRTPTPAMFAFLLSAKAGGMGINLIGASRLVLFDIDWNPSVDLQAMARIHRDGQKKPCFIYRFLMAGGLDEKIWQRQVTKLGLASSIIDQKGGTGSFSREELKDLFRLDVNSTCQTHDLIGCQCGGRGLPDIAIDDAGDEPDTYEEMKDDIPAVRKRIRSSIVDTDTSDSDDEESLSYIGTFIPCSKVRMDQQEQLIHDDERAARANTNGSKMQSLMAYSHVDTSLFATEPDDNLEALITDQLLLKVLKDDETSVNFVFAKTFG